MASGRRGREQGNRHGHNRPAREKAHRPLESDSPPAEHAPEGLRVYQHHEQIDVDQQQPVEDRLQRQQEKRIGGQLFFAQVPEAGVQE